MNAAAPPVIAGFDHLEHLGSGGFAEVHLYEQRVPRRSVAVKVLASRLDDDARRAFLSEATLLGRLSSHPSILTVYDAGVVADGRPYIVMEYCARGSFQDRLAAGPLPVAEAVSLGVQLAGALETAHRAGVVHRDVKPANVLQTDYELPALADFGIASTAGSGVLSGERSLSLPWAPPEYLAEPPWSGPASDVYGLAATILTLLVGHSPYELPGESWGAEQLAARIREGRAPTVPAELPAELREVLEVALSPSPHERHSSSLAFGRALQAVEDALGVPRSRLDVAGGGMTGAVATAGSGSGGAGSGAVESGDVGPGDAGPGGGPASSPTVRSVAGAPSPLGATILRPAGTVMTAATPAAAPAPAATSAPGSPAAPTAASAAAATPGRRRSPLPGILLDAALLVVVLGLGTLWVVGWP